MNAEYREEPESRQRHPVSSAPHRSTGGARIDGLTLGPVEFESPLERHALATLALCHDVLGASSRSRRESTRRRGGFGYTTRTSASAWLPGSAFFWR